MTTLTPTAPVKRNPWIARIIGVIVAIAVGITVALAGSAYLARDQNENPVTPASAKPVSYTSDQFAYTVEFPGKPTETTERQTVLGVEMAMDMVEWNGGEKYAVVGSYPIGSLLPAGAELAQLTAEEVDLMLQSSLDGAVANVKDAKLLGQEYATLDGTRSIHGTASTSAGLLDVVIALRSPTLQVLLTGAFTERAHNAFVDSFHFLPAA